MKEEIKELREENKGFTLLTADVERVISLTFCLKTHGDLDSLVVNYFNCTDPHSRPSGFGEKENRREFKFKFKLGRLL